MMAGGRQLLEWDDNTPEENYRLIGASVFVTLTAGLMSGLTLGLMSLDTTQMEVLMRSGTAKEKKYARRIMPLIKNQHHLLVTLLLCNAGAMTTLPLFLDRLADPFTAVLLSVTAVLFFGEIIPQAICTKYGLIIGARTAFITRFLMTLTAPISWTIGKFLDVVLGHDDHPLFRRQQLKALVDVHGETTGLGGKLSLDEIKVITGALDLTNKIAYKSMTNLRSVVSLSSNDRLDEPTLRRILESGHSRIPVHRGDNRSDLVGLLLVKELLQYKMSKDVPVAALKLRSLPRLSAATPMYDMLKLFQTGRSHMAVLTQPEQDDDEDEPTPAPEAPLHDQQLVEALAVAAIKAAEDEQELQQQNDEQQQQQQQQAEAGGEQQGARAERAASGIKLAEVAAAAISAHTPHVSSNDLLHAASSSSGAAGAGGSRHGPGRGGGVGGLLGRVNERSGHGGGSGVGSPLVERSSGSGSGVGVRRRLQGAGNSSEHGGTLLPGQGRQFSGGSAEGTVDVEGGGEHVHYSEEAFQIVYYPDEDEEGHEQGDEGEGGERGKGENGDKGGEGETAGSRRMRRVPRLAAPGQPIGIITLEDVIEELIHAEILDEMDVFIDNEHKVRVDKDKMAAGLPERMRQALAVGALPAELMRKKTLNRRTREGRSAHASAALTTPLLGASSGG